MTLLQTPQTESELHAAVELLHRVIRADDLRLYDLGISPATVYTTLVTLWMLTLQRLGGGASLNAVIKDVVSQSQGLLPNNKRVREATLSKNSGAYSQARQRLPLSTVQHFAECVSQTLIERTPVGMEGRRTYILDATTTTLAPTSALCEVYPPATNQLAKRSGR